MATTIFPPPIVQQLNQLAATDYEQNAFIDQGDEDDPQDLIGSSSNTPPPSTILPPSSSATLLTLYLSPSLPQNTPLYLLKLFNSPNPPIPQEPLLEDRQVAARELRDERVEFFPDQDPQNENRPANNADCCQGESTDNMVQASIRADGTVRTFWEVDFGLQSEETVQFEVIWHQWVSLELLKRKVPFGLVRVGCESDLDKKVLHFIGRSNLTKLIEVAGDKACVLVTFSGPTDDNKSSLLVVPPNLTLDQDTKGGIIPYARKWSYVRPVHVRRLEESAKHFPSPLDSTLLQQATRQLKPMRTGIPITSFSPRISSILAEAVPKGDLRTTSLGLPNLIDLKQAHLGSLAQILVSPTSATLRNGKAFSSASNFVDEKGVTQTIVMLYQVLKKSGGIQAEIGRVKNDMFGGAVERKRVLWTGEKGSKNGKGTGYFRVSAAGARDYPKDICYAISKTLLSLEGEGGAVVSVVYSVHAPKESDSTTPPLVDLLSSFTYGRDFQESDYSPALLEGSRSLLGSRASMEPVSQKTIGKPLLKMKSSFGTGGLSPIDLTAALRIYERFTNFISKQPLISFVHVDQTAQATVLDTLLTLTGYAKISEKMGRLIVAHAYSLVPEDTHNQIRQKGSNDSMIAGIETGIREDVRSRKRKSDEGVDAENTVTTDDWAAEDSLWES